MKNDNQESFNQTEGEADGGADESGISFEEREFFNYLEANDLDCGEDTMEEEDRKEFAKVKKRFIKAIRDKRAVVDGNKIIYTVSEKTSAPMAGTQITISRPSGRALLVMDGYKDTMQYTKLSAYMAALCRIPKSDMGKITSLDIIDYQFIQDIAILFLTE
jgi:hypothetical protein